MSKRKTPSNKETQEVFSLLTSTESQLNENESERRNASQVQKANAVRSSEIEDVVSSTVNDKTAEVPTAIDNSIEVMTKS